MQKSCIGEASRKKNHYRRNDFLSTAQRSEETDSEILARFSKADSHSNFEAPKHSACPEVELIRLQFSGLKDKVEKPKLQDLQKLR